MPGNSIISQMQIAIVDDHDLVREGIRAILTREGAVRIDDYGNGTSLLAALTNGKTYNIFIIDLELPDINGFVLIESIRAMQPMSRIIVSTVHDEIWTLRKLLARDVNGIIYKSGRSDEFIEAINSIINGEPYYCDQVRKIMESKADNSSHPTTRELEVLYHIAKGKTSKEIAAALFVSENTVETHRKTLFCKLGALNVADLIIKAIEKGYINKTGVVR